MLPEGKKFLGSSAYMDSIKNFGFRIPDRNKCKRRRIIAR